MSIYRGLPPGLLNDRCIAEPLRAALNLVSDGLRTALDPNITINVSAVGLPEDSDPTAEATAVSGATPGSIVVTATLGIPAGAQGPQGETGPAGADGADGADGQTPDLNASATVNGTPGATAVSVSRSGTFPDYVYDFVFTFPEWVEEAPEDNYYYGRRNAAWSKVTEEAPINGNRYGRKDGAWVIDYDPDVEEAPENGKYYGRKDAAWEEVTEEAATDGTVYGRKDGAWVPVQANISGFSGGIIFVDADGITHDVSIINGIISDWAVTPP